MTTSSSARDQTAGNLDREQYQNVSECELQCNSDVYRPQICIPVTEYYDKMLRSDHRVLENSSCGGGGGGVMRANIELEIDFCEFYSFIFTARRGNKFKVKWFLF